MLELFRPEWTGRLHHSQLRTVVADFDALVLSNPLSLRYLTGFDGTSGLLLHGGDRIALLVDGRYEGLVRAAQAGGRMAGVELVKAVAIRSLEGAAAIDEALEERRTQDCVPTALDGIDQIDGDLAAAPEPRAGLEAVELGCIMNAEQCEQVMRLVQLKASYR